MAAVLLERVPTPQGRCGEESRQSVSLACQTRGTPPPQHFTLAAHLTLATVGLVQRKLLADPMLIWFLHLREVLCADIGKLGMELADRLRRPL